MKIFLIICAIVVPIFVIANFLPFLSLILNIKETTSQKGYPEIEDIINGAEKIDAGKTNGAKSKPQNTSPKTTETPTKTPALTPASTPTSTPSAKQLTEEKPTAAIVPQEKCDNKSVIPEKLRNYIYYCADIYSTNAGALKSEVEKYGSERILLKGRNSDFDCPVSVGKFSDTAERCYNKALFTDSKELPKMMAIYGFSQLPQKVLYYHVGDYNEIEKLCEYQGASACFDGEKSLIFTSATSFGEPFYNTKPSSASFYEGANHEIKYEFTSANPAGCYLSDVHETIHFLNFLYNNKRYMRDWFEEAITHGTTLSFVKEICPPGIILTNVYKTENGVKTSISNFNILSLDDDFPLPSALESYSEGSECRRAIFREFMRMVEQRGLAFLPQYLSEVNKLNKSYDVDFSRALYYAAGSPADMKEFLQNHSCN